MPIPSLCTWQKDSYQLAAVHCASGRGIPIEVVSDIKAVLLALF